MMYEDDSYPPNRYSDNDVPAERKYEIVWPPGYWDEYEKLKAEARKVTRDDSICLVMKLNHAFCVRTKGIVPGARGFETPVLYGPDARDRLDAWKAFLASLIVTRPGTSVAGAKYNELLGKKRTAKVA